MRNKNHSSKRNKQTSKSGVSITDLTVFASSPSSPSSSSIASSMTISSNTTYSSVTTTTTTARPSSLSSSPSSSSSISPSTSILGTKAALPALTVKIVERKGYAVDTESRDELSSSLTGTTLADIDSEDIFQIGGDDEYQLNKLELLAQATENGDTDVTQQTTIENRNDVTEVEKKQAMSSLEEAQRPQVNGMKGHDWVVLGALTAITLTVRMWDIQAPGVVVMDEAHVGKYVNGYLTKQFIFDRHPPLGKMLLAGISSATSNYTGTFPFDEIGDAYPKTLPFAAMRATMALMGALCAPMAYITLRAIGQSGYAASVATILIAFDNALTANNRLMTLDAPLMFFTALSSMSWNMFAKQSFRPFSALWWTWLVMTGLAVSGALTTKASGIFTLLTIGTFAAKNMLNLAFTRSVGGVLFAKHLIPRVALILLLPVASYIYLFHLHFERQFNRPFGLQSPYNAYDLNMLSYPFRNSLLLTSPESMLAHGFSDPELEPIWKDVVYGSVIQLRSDLRPPLYLHSFHQRWPKESTQQQVSGYDYPDLNTNWIIVKALSDKDKAAGVDEIPSRLRYVRHGDIIKLRHVPTRKCLHSHNVRTIGQFTRDQYCEVSAYGSPSIDGDSNGWRIMEVVDGEKMIKLPKTSDTKITALETAIRFKHLEHKCYLSVTDDMLPPDMPGGAGRRELACLKDAKVNSKSIWRITVNDHDYLPVDTDIASYPKISFSKKFKELHKLMWSTPRAFEQAGTLTMPTIPLSWPLATSKNIIHIWRKVSTLQGVDGGSTQARNVQQISLIANPIVWWTGLFGVLGYLSAHTVIMLREKRGYVSQEFKQKDLPGASIFFAGWAIHYFPYLLLSTEKHNLTTHHYFPALYFSILLSCTLLSGLLRHVLAGSSNLAARSSLWIGLSVIAIAAFIQISPFTYGTLITPDRYESLEQWIYRDPLQRPSHFATLEYSKNHNTTTDSGIPAWSLLFSQRVQVPRPAIRELAPVLEMYYPDKDEALPRDDVFMTPSQRPPQLWDVNTQKGRPNAYQRQQMHSVLEMIKNEENEKAVKEEEEKKMLESSIDQDPEAQQQLQQHHPGDSDSLEDNVLTQEDASRSALEELVVEDAHPLSDQQQDLDRKTRLEETFESTPESVEKSDSDDRKSKFLASLAFNAQSYALQKFNEGNSYGPLDGWGIPLKFDFKAENDGDEAKCSSGFSNTGRNSLQDTTMKRSKMRRALKYREEIRLERYRAKLRKDKEKQEEQLKSDQAPDPLQQELNELKTSEAEGNGDIDQEHDNKN
ncbi:hypothetical protein BGX27_001252 [Mortierella sp. AM989]|nr:hypothetical protein BGX27_001252 [Mortierella sp. AM989]